MGKPQSVTITQLANGNGFSLSKSVVSLCYDDESFIIRFQSFEQLFYSNVTFDECNDSVYILDVVESFISPYWQSESSGPHCYTEIDLSPFDQVYQSGIVNKNLNHSGVTNFPLNCDESGIQHRVDINDSNPSIWSATVIIPWSIIANPNGCPTSSNQSDVAEGPISIMRANFYRVNELVPTNKCTSSLCEYTAWSPTLSDPPAFHEPTKFGYLFLSD